MEEKVIIVNPKKFEESKRKIKEQGASKFHVLSDFDRTITCGVGIDGKRTATLISQLRSNPKYLGQEYMDRANELFDLYHPIEVDPEISLEEKKKKMHEWWRKHFDLIIDAGLTKQLVEQVVSENSLKFRKGSFDFVKFLEKKGIPLVFMSAAPGDLIEEHLKKERIFLSNVYVLGNRYRFDANGNAIKIKEPIIHTFNKTEISLRHHPVFSSLKNRRNILLLGDSVGDVGMVEGFDYDNLIKIGFLNEDVDKNLDLYKKNFDVVLTGDQDFNFINKLVEEMFE